MNTKIEKIPVFEHNPQGDISFSTCLGWVANEAEACELLLAKISAAERAEDIPGIGKFVFGGVMKGYIRMPTEDGPHRDSKGLYRWQPYLHPFLDSAKNAGKPTLLNDVYIYDGASNVQAL